MAPLGAPTVKFVQNSNRDNRLCVVLAGRVHDDQSVDEQLSMALRRYGRIAVEFPASFSGASFRAQGVIVDISLSGCRVHSDLAVHKDERLGVLIEVPGYDHPLYISQAAIRWANAKEFGVEFLEMELTDRQKLHEVVMKSADPG